MKTPVVVFGAGKIGRMVAYLLQSCGDFEVLSVDSSERHVAEVQALAPGVKGMVARFDDSAALDKALSGRFAALSCAPFFCNELIATRAKHAHAHYLDLTEDVAVTKKVNQLAKNSKTAFVPQCGLAPGFITIAACHVMHGMQDIHDVKLRVGALPEHPANAMKYNLTWSTNGLINEYCQPCEAVVDGQFTTVPPLEQLEHITINGIEFEAFNTSGGLGTLAETMHGKVRHMNYKTMRYPGHQAILKLLLQDLRFIDDREGLAKVFERAIPTTQQDIVAIFTSAIGTIGGHLTERTFASIVRHREMGGHHWTAIQITTAAGICAVVDMLRQERLPTHGFVRNEQISFADFMANRFGALYA